MNQEKIGNFIRKIRIEKEMTQQELADKIGVTDRAISKWENGKNMPDTSLIKQMSKDFQISLEEMFEGELKPQKSPKKNNVPLITLIIIIIAIIIIGLFSKNDGDFKFKTLSSQCNNFNISGNIGGGVGVASWGICSAERFSAAPVHP